MNLRNSQIGAENVDTRHAWGYSTSSRISDQEPHMLSRVPRKATSSPHDGCTRQYNKNMIGFNAPLRLILHTSFLVPLNVSLDGYSTSDAPCACRTHGSDAISQLSSCQSCGDHGLPMCKGYQAYLKLAEHVHSSLVAPITLTRSRATMAPIGSTSLLRHTWKTP